MLRNVAVARENRGSPEAVPVLATARTDGEPLIRGHAAWALGRIGTRDEQEAPRGTEAVEEVSWLREELGLAFEPG